MTRKLWEVIAELHPDYKPHRHWLASKTGTMQHRHSPGLFKHAHLRGRAQTCEDTGIVWNGTGWTTDEVQP